MTSVLNPWDGRHGGGQIVVDRLAESLQAGGTDVSVIYSSREGKRPPTAPSTSYEMSFVRHHDRLYLHPPAFAHALRGFAGDVDVVHCQGYEGALFRNVTRNALPVVATNHHPDPASIVSRPGGLKRLPWMRHNIVALMESRALRRSDHIVCSSAHSARVLQDRGHFSAGHPVSVVHNGVDLDPGAIRDPEPESMLCVARLDHHKGIDVLFEALCRMEHEHATLVIAGEGQLRSRLESLAQSLGIQSRVDFIGLQTPEALRSLRSRAALQVLPSRSENFPLVILEGLAAGMPQVTTRVGGIPEAVRDDIEALLVPPDDPVALASALDRLLRDDSLRRRMESAARLRATEFTWTRAAESLLNLYEQVQPRRRGSV